MSITFETLRWKLNLCCADQTADEAAEYVMVVLVAVPFMDALKRSKLLLRQVIDEISNHGLFDFM